MRTKVYIDGSEGTTGLRINERFQDRDDIELIRIDPELRKDPVERKKKIEESDITFLCLPDAAAIEAVSLLEDSPAKNDKVKIIDASTAHRTKEGWAYGFPELSKEYRDKIISGNRIAVPGCHATGFISMVYPLVKENFLAPNYPVSAFSLTGYSGGGKGMIREYEENDRPIDFDAPREYALSQNHKHLREMKFHCGLNEEPLFSPIVSDYYSGMLVSLPIYVSHMQKKVSPEEVREFFYQYYINQPLIEIMEFGAEASDRGFLSGKSCTGWDGLRIFVTGNADRLLVSAQFDNLGKGASGAAIQCLNLMTGRPDGFGLVL